jgi:heat shock protein HslJ
MLQLLAALATHQPNPLENRTWQAVTWQENGAIVRIVPNSTITANFTPSKQIGGTTGCNLYSGKYQLRGQKFSLAEGLITTKRGCTEDLARQESAVLSALRGSKRLMLDRQGRLTLGYKSETGTGTITLVDRTTILPNLAKTQWQLVATESGNVYTNLEKSPVTIGFTKGKASGFGGCNSYESSYVQKGDRISFPSLTFTERACAESLRNGAEQEFFKGLAGVDRFDIDNAKTQLVLSYPNGKFIFSNAKIGQ